MSENNLLAEGIEKLGCRTFSTVEMAFNLLGLMHPRMTKIAQERPLRAVLSGGLNFIPDINRHLKQIRDQIRTTIKVQRALREEEMHEQQRQESASQKAISPRSNMRFDFFPIPKEHQKLPGNPGLRELLDLERTVVIVGMGEVGPWGGHRTRWEMEQGGTFSLEGCIEMAWMMGMIEYRKGVDGQGKPFASWCDTKTGQPVSDMEIRRVYEPRILAHSGIRLIDPTLFEGYSGETRNVTQEVAIEQDMFPLEMSREEAEAFKLRHGAQVDVFPRKDLEPGSDDDRWMVRFRKGAILFFPKALRFDRLVAGQIPTGWDPRRYGIPEEIVEQVDPVTLYTLVACMEALVGAGITDPYELYSHIHVSELGSMAGGGVGGQRANQRIFRGRFLDRPVQADILQESFINTTPAWINLLLLSASGPIKSPVGACGTALQSLEMGVETILSGKAKVAIVGGFDDFREEGSYEFASMQATSSAVDEAARGRQPDEQSRPMASSRAGFMESQGSGIQVLMTAKLAIEMGCPILAVVASTNTAMDREGRSIPAPGQGILTTARRVQSDHKPRNLNLEYRLSSLRQEREQLKEWLASKLQTTDPSQHADLHGEAERRLKSLKRFWGHDWSVQDDRVAPLEAGLATFGLTIDDVGIASFHGTGTKANDPNESHVVQQQLVHLGRSTGNMLPVICQKYLTGHPKGAAGAWMVNG